MPQCSTDGLWHRYRAADPQDVVPAQQLFVVAEKLCVTAAADFYSELLHAVRGIRGGIAQDVKHRVRQQRQPAYSLTKGLQVRILFAEPNIPTSKFSL
jgi:hypothetical protein